MIRGALASASPRKLPTAASGIEIEGLTESVLVLIGVGV